MIPIKTNTTESVVKALNTLERKYGEANLPPLVDEFETAAHNYMENRLSRK